METTIGSITRQNEGFIDENRLFTYSEAERQRHEVADANAKLVFLPEFIPYYPSVKAKYQLSAIETLLYGFIRFFLTNASDRFYFGNEQLATLLEVSEKTISLAVTSLTKKGVIKTGYKIKAEGGKIRFISEFTGEPRLQNVMLEITKGNENKNKIKDNNTNIIVPSGSANARDDINSLISLFRDINPSYKNLYANKTQRAAIERMLKEHGEARLAEIIKSLPAIVTRPYAPRITTPYELEKNLGKLAVFISQERGKNGRFSIVSV